MRIAALTDTYKFNHKHKECANVLYSASRAIGAPRARPHSRTQASELHCPAHTAPHPPAPHRHRLPSPLPPSAHRSRPLPTLQAQAPICLLSRPRLCSKATPIAPIFPIPFTEVCLVSKTVREVVSSVRAMSTPRHLAIKTNDVHFELACSACHGERVASAFVLREDRTCGRDGGLEGWRLAHASTSRERACGKGPEVGNGVRNGACRSPGPCSGDHVGAR